MTRTVQAAVAAICLAGAAASQNARPAASPGATVLMRQASNASFSLDYPAALAAAGRAVEIDPERSATHRVAAWVAWNHMLFLRGAMTVDYYIGGTTKSLSSLPRPPADLQSAFHRELDRAIAIATAEVDKNKRDVTALYDLGAAYGLQASYAASIEGKPTAAFGSARRAFDAHERVLDLDPTRVDAGVIVGTYRYIVATFALPMRVFAYMAGFGGGKDKGIGMLEAAARGSQSPEDAEFALILVYTRERRDEDALTVIRALERRFPANRLLVLEEGGTLLRGQQAAEAEAVLTAGLARFARDERPQALGERALWLWKRGAARVMLGRQDAAVDLGEALGANPPGWISGRIHLELGKVADLRGDRSSAVKEYTRAAATARDNSDALCQSEADRLTKRPFTLSPGLEGGLNPP